MIPYDIHTWASDSPELKYNATDFRQQNNDKMSTTCIIFVQLTARHQYKYRRYWLKGTNNKSLIS